MLPAPAPGVHGGRPWLLPPETAVTVGVVCVIVNVAGAALGAARTGKLEANWPDAVPARL